MFGEPAEWRKRRLERQSAKYPELSVSDFEGVMKVDRARRKRGEEPTSLGRDIETSLIHSPDYTPPTPTPRLGGYWGGLSEAAERFNPRPEARSASSYLSNAASFRPMDKSLDTEMDTPRVLTDAPRWTPEEEIGQLFRERESQLLQDGIKPSPYDLDQMRRSIESEVRARRGDIGLTPGATLATMASGIGHNLDRPRGALFAAAEESGGAILTNPGAALRGVIEGVKDPGAYSGENILERSGMGDSDLLGSLSAKDILGGVMDIALDPTNLVGASFLKTDDVARAALRNVPDETASTALKAGKKFSLAGGAGPARLNAQSVAGLTKSDAVLNAVRAAQRDGIGEVGSEVARALEQADVIVKADKPGAIGNLLNDVPGLGKLRAMDQPRFSLPDDILTAHVAESSARAEFAQTAFASQRTVLKEMADEFGEEALSGGLAKVRFLGTPEQADLLTPSGKPLTGSLLDIVQNPALYDLTKTQRDLLEKFSRRNDDLIEALNNGYGAELGKFVPEQGGYYLPNIDMSEQAMAKLDNEFRAVSTGRAKTRVYSTARSRLEADPTFGPQLDVRLLVAGMDASKANIAGSQVFKQGVGGYTKLELVEKLNPNLASLRANLTKTVDSLRGQIARAEDAIGRDSSAARALQSQLDETGDRIETLVERQARYASDPNRLAEVDILEEEIDELARRFLSVERDLDSPIGRIAAKDARLFDLRDQLDAAKANLKDVRRSYEAVNPRGHEWVPELFRYFPTEVAPQVRELRKTADSGFQRWLADWNATVLSGDASPITGVQGPLVALFSPRETAAQVIKGLGSSIRQGDPFAGFRAQNLADDIARDPQSWGDFAFFTGRAITSGAPAEQGGGILNKVGWFRSLNDGMYVGLQRSVKRMWDDNVADLVASGVDPTVAKAASADMVTKAIPQLNASRLGQSAAQAQFQRTPFTSISFIRQPAALMQEAAQGYVKMGLGQARTPKEILATRMFTRLAGTTMTLSIGSALANAKVSGRDPMDAVMDAINPLSGEFAHIFIPGTDASIPLGGPFRALLLAIAPRPVETPAGEVWMPFANLTQFFTNRAAPVFRTQIDLIRNKDFHGNKIVTGEFPINAIQLAAYEFENALPLSFGSAVEGVRTDASRGEIVEGVLTGLAGQNVSRQTPMEKLNEIAQSLAGKDFMDLEPVEQQALEIAHPDLAEARREKGSEERDLRLSLTEAAKARQLEDDQALIEMRMTPEDWKEARRLRNAELSGAVSQIYRDMPERKADPEKPWEVYGWRIAETERKYGSLTPEAWDEIDAWRATLSEEDNAAIDRNVGLSSTDVEADYRRVVREMDKSGGFDLYDRTWKAIQTHPELGEMAKAYPSYSDWFSATEREVYRIILQSGKSSVEAQSEAAAAVQKHPLYGAFSTTRQNLTTQWVLENPEVAIDASAYALFAPVKELRSALGSYSRGTGVESSLEEMRR